MIKSSSTNNGFKLMNHIAIKMLMGDKGKYLGIVMGLTFASLIMTQQPAIFLGLMSRSYSFISDVGLPER